MIISTNCLCSEIDLLNLHSSRIFKTTKIFMFPYHNILTFLLLNPILVQNIRTHTPMCTKKKYYKPIASGKYPRAYPDKCRHPPTLHPM